MSEIDLRAMRARALLCPKDDIWFADGMFACAGGGPQPQRLAECASVEHAAHIAGLDPQTVLALLDRLERAETAAEQAREKLAAICDALAANGCDCDCGHASSECSCEWRCFACRINAIVQP